ncbi:MAG TPA: LssY C-terminal domain-containing protein, partial [Acidobacteriaceae bacterium]|nr:LssY C-terminal domain-containing protein [Acidobacteriaceae bacterium]
RLSNGLRYLIASCCLTLFAFAPALPAETIPAGTPLEIRIQQPISSYSTPAGTKITGILISPVNEGGRILVPLGTTVEGSVLSVRRVGLGFAHETAEIELRFDRLVLADHGSIPIQVRITNVENARESINKKGRIQGIRSTSTLSNRASGIVGSLAFGDPIAAIFTTAGSACVLRFSEPEITLPAGTELLAQLAIPVDLPGLEAQTVPPLVTTADGRKQLGEMVHRLPFRTFTEGKKELPSDFTNLVFIGSADALQHAFAASGWVIVDTLTAQTTYGTIRSVAENQGYRRAPMSILLLDGNAPDYAYAKTLNTFSKRHHLRIWTSKETWDGEPVWTSSSTHDIGIGFSKKDKTFIHLIDSNIDNERAKVVNDLIYTGCVSGVQLVKRPWLPADAKNGTGEDLITDGRIAVLQLNDCQHPIDEANGQAVAALRTHGNRFDRTTRQTVLTLKNNIMRDNVGMMAYSGIRYGLDAKKRKEAAPQRNMNVDGERYTIDTGFRQREAYTTLSTRPQSKTSSTAKAGAWTPPSVEFGLRGGFHGYYGGNGGAVAYVLTDVNPNDVLALVLGNSLHDGWELGGTVTLNPQKYLSHEFSYDHAFTEFNLGLAVVGNDSTSQQEISQIVFDQSGLHTSQFTYNLLFNFRPKTSRLRPYLAVGPSLSLMHLADAPIKKAPGWYRLGLANIGLISAAYNFGSDPPLDGGGIFEAGLNYGGGIRYRLTPRWMIRADYRETLTAQPDFWSKSQKDILSGIDTDPGTTLTVVGPVLDGAMRQDHVTMGLSFTF